MSDESTPNGSNNGEYAPQLPSALARADRAGATIGAQIGWQFAGDGSAQVIEKPAIVKNRRHDAGSLRSDARRAAEYLASRGKTPIEALHDIAGTHWRKAVRQIARELQCSKLEAFKVWLSCQTALLPYSAARFDTIELGGQLGAAGGSLTVAHFLAASMVAERMGAVGFAPMSTDGQSVDSTVIEQLPLLDGGGQTAAKGLPPKPAD
jgi:hypothetical protein